MAEILAHKYHPVSMASRFSAVVHASIRKTSPFQVKDLAGVVKTKTPTRRQPDGRDHQAIGGLNG